MLAPYAFPYKGSGQSFILNQQSWQLAYLLSKCGEAFSALLESGAAIGSDKDDVGQHDVIQMSPSKEKTSEIHFPQWPGINAIDKYLIISAEN